jgi:hypothetical protein
MAYNERTTVRRHFTATRCDGQPCRGWALWDETEDGRHKRLRPERLYKVHAWMRTYDRFWQTRLAALGTYLDRARGSGRALMNTVSA